MMWPAMPAAGPGLCSGLRKGEGEMRMTRPANAPSYDEDFVGWLEDQARRARRGEADELDLENIAEEFEGMARSDRREIRNRLIVLLIHLLKYSAQPRRRSSGWPATIGEQRSRIATVIDDSPSLKSFPGSILDQCYADARSRAAIETGLPESNLPERCPFGVDEVHDLRWLPPRQPLDR
jgi:hypothetical protein